MSYMQVPESVQERLIREIQNIISSTSQSNIPAIYGMAAAAEVKRLRPMSSEIAEVGLQVSTLTRAS